ncbi:MAG: hypothetical protein L0219_02905 [Phycisphaerales bacterium]|nr:hypothetical protein [Phycisphaerales bacterium]
MLRSTGPVENQVGFALTRVVVPLWVLAGAAFKLYERTPVNLPSGILAVAKAVGLDLELLLRTLIGLELFAVGVMVFVPRLARPMAIFMLSCFCGILVWEMVRDATKCGCFGALAIKPWQMLIVDGALLLSVLIARPRRAPATAAAMEPETLGPPRGPWTKPALCAFALAIVGLGVAFAVPQKAAKEQTPINRNSNDPTINPQPLPIPNSFGSKLDVQSWVGRSWRDIDLFQLMPRWPKDMDAAKRYVVFYSRTCEHCQEMFELYLIIPLDGPVAAVEIPASPTELRGENPWEMPEAPVEYLELPLGCNWIITSPIVVTVESGTITCATEGANYQTCFGLN